MSVTRCTELTTPLYTDLTFNVIWPLNAALAAFRGRKRITRLFISFEKREISSLNVRFSLIADLQFSQQVRSVPNADVDNVEIC